MYDVISAATIQGCQADILAAADTQSFIPQIITSLEFRELKKLINSVSTKLITIRV